MDTKFQTIEHNAERMAEIELARSIVRNAENVLEEAILSAFPVGAHVRINVAPHKYSYFIVERHTKYPSKWMHLKNRNTGTVTMKDMTTHGINLVTYAYVVEDIDRALQTGSAVTYSADLEPERRGRYRKNIKEAA